jgi:GTPase KRas protein
VEEYDPFGGEDDRKELLIDGEPCLLDILDTAGQDEYAALREQIIRTGEGFLIVYSISSRSSFLKVKTFFDQIQNVKQSNLERCTMQPTPNHWQTPQYPSFSKVGAMPAIFIVGNKRDLTDQEREVSYKEGSALAASLGVTFVETSAKTRYNVHEVFCDLAREMNLEARLVMEAIDQDQDDPIVLGKKTLASQMELLRASQLREIRD